MVATISVDSYTVAFADSHLVWKIHGDLVRCVGDTQFLKVKPYDQALVRLVCESELGLDKNTKYTIAGCVGFKDLLRLRNEAAFKATIASEDAATFAAVKVFGKGAGGGKKPFTRHNPRYRAHELRDLRDTPETVELELEAMADLPAHRITVMRPCHPCEDLTISFTPECVEHVIAYIKSKGVDRETLTQRRSYGGGPDGAWKNGSAGLVKRVAEQDCGDEAAEAPKKRFTTLSNWLKVALPIADQDESDAASNSE